MLRRDRVYALPVPVYCKIWWLRECIEDDSLCMKSYIIMWLNAKNFDLYLWLKRGKRGHFFMTSESWGLYVWLLNWTVWVTKFSCFVLEFMHALIVACISLKLPGSWVKICTAHKPHVDISCLFCVSLLSQLLQTLHTLWNLQPTVALNKFMQITIILLFQFRQFIRES